MARIIPNSANKKLSTAANLANLLPTGTTLAFQALMPSFTNSGSCLPAHKYLTSSAIVCFSFVCLIFSFTDSFVDRNNGKLYYGIATFKGLYIFNKDDNDDNNDTNPNQNEENNQSAQHNEERIINHDEEGGEIQKEIEPSRTKDDIDEDEVKKVLAKYRIQFIDFVHAFCSCLVFVVYAMCSSDVQRCLYPHPSDNGTALMMNLPLAVGTAVSFLFMLFPTKRRGIGFADKDIQK